MLRAALLPLLVLAAPALGQGACPGAADLAGGIRVEYDDGSAELFRATGAPGVVAVRGDYRDGSGYRLELGQGVHLLSYTPATAGEAPAREQRALYDYGRAADELPVPAPGRRFDVAVTVTDAFGPREEAQSQAYGAAEVLAIGGCSYEAVPVMIAYDSVNAYVEALRYLPELGIALLTWQEGTDLPRREIAPVAIRAGK